MAGTWATQADADVRLEWGAAATAVPADHVVVVDVLRFTTAVDVAVGRGATVYPYRWGDESAPAFAASVEAVLADGTHPGGPSLSPARLQRTEPGDRIVLPSPNGSTCAALAAEAGVTVLAACLRNAEAVAAWLRTRPGSVLVVPCGERWPDGSLRPALEDLLGAGAVVSDLPGRRSPEAEAAALTWDAVRTRVAELVTGCSSGREATERGWVDDLELACEVGASTAVPVLRSGAFVDARQQPA